MRQVGQRTVASGNLWSLPTPVRNRRDYMYAKKNTLKDFNDLNDINGFF